MLWSEGGNNFPSSVHMLHALNACCSHGHNFFIDEHQMQAVTARADSHEVMAHLHTGMTN